MNRNWPMAAYFVFIGGVVGWGAIEALEPRLCAAGKLREAARQQDVVVFACWEFWLNRYQGLIGSGLTAVVAAITLVWIGRQLHSSNRQAAVAAAQSLRQRRADLLHEFRQTIDAANFASSVPSRLDAMREGDIDAAIAELRKFAHSLTVYGLADDGEVRTKQRRTFTRKLRGLADELDMLILTRRHNRRHAERLTGAHGDTERHLRQRIDAAASELNGLFASVAAAAQTEAEQVSQQICNFELFATNQREG